jgi:hypothetical protein
MDQFTSNETRHHDRISTHYNYILERDALVKGTRIPSRPGFLSFGCRGSNSGTPEIHFLSLSGNEFCGGSQGSLPTKKPAHQNKEDIKNDRIR